MPGLAATYMFCLLFRSVVDVGDDVVDLESAVVRRGAAVNDLEEGDEDAGVVADVWVVRAARDGEAPG